MTSFHRLARPLAIACAWALLATLPAAAQEATPATAPVTTELGAMPAATGGPALDAASVGVRAHSATTAPAKEAAAATRSNGTALMIVGGAAVLTGIVIGNDAGYAISVVGAIVGLYGLYKYLQ